jgi:antitoxin component of MazEF toxin-antitoxin module
MFDFGKRKIMNMNYTRYLALPKAWIDAMRLEKGDQVKIEMDNENMPILSDVRNEIPAAGADISVTTPGTDGYQTQGAGADGKTFSIQRMPNGRTWIFRIFIGAGESAILLEIVGDGEHPTTGHRWCDRVKYFVGCVIRNWWLLIFVWNIFCG